MASKRAKALTAAVVQDVAGRDLPMKQAHGETTEGLQKDHGRPTTYHTRVRVPQADHDMLEALAAAEGTTVSAIIRRAIKELLRRQGAGLR